MTVTPPCDTQMVTTQLRLLSGGDLPQRPSRPRQRRAGRPTRARTAAAIRLDARTRQIGKSGVAEARRRLAEITATTERVQDLVKAS